jgi:hypothetical protein
MYKNFNITESEKEQILNRLKENGYGQPINEQKAPIKKPVTSGKVDQGLVQKLNILKELVGAVVNNVDFFVPKTVKLAEGNVAIINTDNILNNVLGGDPNFSPYSNLSTIFRCPFVVFGDTKAQIRIISFELHGNSSRMFQDGTLSSQLAKSKDINEFYQNLNKYKPEVYSKEEPIYGTKELGIDVLNQESFTLPIYSIIDFFPNKLDGINKIKTVVPNFVQLSLNALAIAKDTESRKGKEDVVKYYQKVEDEFVSLINQRPEAPTQQQPVQGQPTPTQPQKPLNEGQEILKDVFKTLIK